MEERYGWPLVRALLIIAAVVSLNWWVFKRFTGTNYFIWYLQKGALIGFTVSFVSLIWEGLQERERLLSAHPGDHLVGCIVLMTSFFNSVKALLSTARKSDDAETFSVRSGQWDSWLGLFTLLIIMILTLAWVIVVAPLNYFVTIFSGALARQGMRASERAIVIRTGKTTVFTSQLAKAPLPPNAVDVSLAAKPFALTQAVSALFLWIASTVYESMA